MNFAPHQIELLLLQGDAVMVFSKQVITVMLVLNIVTLLIIMMEQNITGARGLPMVQQLGVQIIQ